MNIMIIYMYTGPVQGKAPVWGKIINLPSIWSFAAMVLLLFFFQIK